MWTPLKNASMALANLLGKCSDTWLPAPTAKGEKAVELKQEGAIANSPSSSLVKPQPSIDDMRDQLIQQEFVEETQSRKSQKLHIVPAGEESVSAREERRFTEDGLLTVEEDFLLRTAEGRLIRSDELHHGGKCFICQKYTDGENASYCAVCRHLLCFACACPWEDGKLCPAHYRAARFQQDTWAADEKERGE